MKLSAVIFALTFYFSGSHQQCFSDNDTSPILNEDQVDSWVNTRKDFSLSLFKHLNKEKSFGNLIFSPSSVHEVLLLAYFGAARETEAFLAKVLQLPNNMKKAQVWEQYRPQPWMTYADKNVFYAMQSASKIFFSSKFSLRPCIVEKLNEETELIDYQTDVEWARNYINNWVAKVTKGKIKDFIKSLSPDSTATLVNAVTFKAKWQNEFNPNYTQYLPFHVNSKESKTAKMMVKTYTFFVDHMEEIGARLLKLPYNRDEQSMIILLPDNDLDTMIESLNSETIRLITDSKRFMEEKLKVVIPKYKKRNSITLSPALAKLGIGNGLSGNADYSRFTGKKEVYFTEVMQEALIEVDEEGTKAIAVTVEVAASSAPILSKPFICDRPFAYFIYDNFFRKILFMGTFRDPDPL